MMKECHISLVEKLGGESPSWLRELRELTRSKDFWPIVCTGVALGYGAEVVGEQLYRRFLAHSTKAAVSACYGKNCLARVDQVDRLFAHKSIAEAK